MVSDKLIIRAERTKGEQTQYLCKVFDLKELLLSSRAPIEAIFPQVVDKLEWVEEWGEDGGQVALAALEIPYDRTGFVSIDRGSTISISP